MELAAATVRGLILTVSHKEQIGGLYPQVLETLSAGLRGIICVGQNKRRSRR